MDTQLTPLSVITDDPPNDWRFSVSAESPESGGPYRSPFLPRPWAGKDLLDLIKEFSLPPGEMFNYPKLVRPWIPAPSQDLFKVGDRVRILTFEGKATAYAGAEVEVARILLNRVVGGLSITVRLPSGVYVEGLRPLDLLPLPKDEGVTSMASAMPPKDAATASEPSVTAQKTCPTPPALLDAKRIQEIHTSAYWNNKGPHRVSMGVGFAAVADAVAKERTALGQWQKNRGDYFQSRCSELRREQNRLHSQIEDLTKVKQDLIRQVEWGREIQRGLSDKVIDLARINRAQDARIVEQEAKPQEQPAEETTLEPLKVGDRVKVLCVPHSSDTTSGKYAGTEGRIKRVAEGLQERTTYYLDAGVPVEYYFFFREDLELLAEETPAATVVEEPEGSQFKHEAPLGCTFLGRIRGPGWAKRDFYFFTHADGEDRLISRSGDGPTDFGTWPASDDFKPDSVCGALKRRYLAYKKQEAVKQAEESVKQAEESAKKADEADTPQYRQRNPEKYEFLGRYHDDSYYFPDFDLYARRDREGKEGYVLGVWGGKETSDLSTRYREDSVEPAAVEARKRRDQRKPKFQHNDKDDQFLGRFTGSDGIERDLYVDDRHPIIVFTARDSNTSRHFRGLTRVTTDSDDFWQEAKRRYKVTRTGAAA